MWERDALGEVFSSKRFPLGEALPQRQNVLARFSTVGHLVYGLTHHVDAQPSHRFVLEWDGGVHRWMCQRIEGFSIILH